MSVGSVGRLLYCIHARGLPSLEANLLSIKQGGLEGPTSRLADLCMNQSVGTPLRVCKSVCIEEKITERKVADYVASKERNATPNSCDQQPSVLLFSPLYTRTYIHEGGFRHSGMNGINTINPPFLATMLPCCSKNVARPEACRWT